LPPPRPPVNPTTHTATPPMIIKDHTNGVAPAMATANDKGVGNAHGVHQATVTAVNRPADTPMNVPVETDAVMRAFREALGVPDLRLDEDSAAELGGMVRSLLDGMMELLRAQSEIKAEFRLPVTRMKRQGNNPFKFSPRSEEALVALFLRRSAAYLAPTEAVDEALADLRAHQLAMIGGLRDAYAQLLNTLSAKALESRFGGETKDSLFSSRASRESQLWKSYAALIEDWREHIGDSFIQNFGQDFAEAYEGHVDAARRARKEGGDAY
jgi:type VI secretion system FHA domain protein